MQDQYHKFIFNIRWKFSFTLSTKLKKNRNEKGISEKKTRVAFKNLISVPIIWIVYEYMDAFEFLCPLQQVSHLYCLTLFL